MADRFTKATAVAIGRSERAIQRIAQRGEELGQEILDKVSGTTLAKGTELDAMVKLDKDKRTELAARAAAGERVSAWPVVAYCNRCKFHPQRLWLCGPNPHRAWSVQRVHGLPALRLRPEFSAR
ncbi:hypothetical protein CHELA1G11_10611 [Hyphomicrobiales bacterium]|nr:hypothetical protein CHELA1G11_10611 [Hyphomicrobiales bacterium]CAH1673455.1 hypothetical protein CHELA1G2_13692 [Hyphomicrobiales bacterium]